MDTLQLGSVYSRYYAKKAARDLCGLPKTKVRPDFEFGTDEQSWTGPNPRNKSRRLIHIGLKGFGQFPDGVNVCENENEWHMNVRHVLTHEEGHVFHTTDRAWQMAQVNGVRNVISYCYEKTTGTKLYARDDKQYEQAVQDLFMNHGLMINMDMVQKFVHMIINSVEDGRMERRMAASRPGFKADLRACRGKRWLHSPIAFNGSQAPNLDDPALLLITVCNQILSFSTMGIWQRGYTDYLVGTKAEEQVQKLLPYIRSGVTARSCKQGMIYAGKIIEQLCPLFYDACTIKDFPKQLMDMLKQLAGALPDMDKNGDSSTQYDADEHSQEQSETDPGKGDYQLSDETDESGDSSETGVSFNIFTDDESDEEKSEEDSSADESKSKSGKGKGNLKDAVANDKSDASEQSEEESSKDGAATHGGASGSKNQHAAKLQDADIDSVERAMKEAIEEAASESSYTKQAVKQSGKTQKKPVYDNTSIEDEIDVSAICTDFKEFFRAYPLTEDLPVSIEQEALVIRRKYEEYFQSLRRPTVRGQRSGRLDLRSLTRVATRSLDVFTQPGEDHSFSGCIEVLVDRSGSMGGEKMNRAMEICAMLEEIFKGLLPLKITAFDMHGGTIFEIIKNWEDSLPKNGCWNFLKYGRSGGGTPTEEALLISEKELLSRCEKHKLLILITDENAMCAGSGVHDAIKHVRASGIQLSAFYIEKGLRQRDIDAFKELFDNTDALAIDPKELSGAMLPVVKKFTHQK